MKICNLCNKNEATQTNSHIIPKYFGRSLLKSHDGKPKGFKIDENSIGKNVKPFQDTPKEDYILCPSCEESLGTIERKFANEFFNKYLTDQQIIECRKVLSPNGYEIINPDEVDYENFKRLFYSIIWRAQISSLDYFHDLDLPPSQIEKLRQILNNEIAFKDLPFIVLTTINDFDKTRNYIYAISSQTGESFLWANEYLVFFEFESKKGITKEFPDLLITSENGIKIGVLPISTWDSLRNTIIRIKVSEMNKK